MERAKGMYGIPSKPVARSMIRILTLLRKQNIANIYKCQYVKQNDLQRSQIRSELLQKEKLYGKKQFVQQSPTDFARLWYRLLSSGI